MISLKIHDHALKHGIAKEDIVRAWTNPMAMRRRTAPHEGEIVAIGPDMKGRPMQMVAAEDWEGIVIFHAMRPPTRRVLDELNPNN